MLSIQKDTRASSCEKHYIVSQFSILQTKASTRLRIFACTDIVRVPYQRPPDALTNVLTTLLNLPVCAR